ncbi:hypothetical protein [Achromobacter insolitus]|uniref:hypothetical protein n=1 Tax=Achromobacter insolitus TaxID=217204 RepID=UPI0020A5A3A5|nr:hypothetical protein [Achromobacter insolitus]MCP1404470.1 hypothetical protein [Achromobacter insolitus]
MSDLIERLRENASLDASEGGNPDVIALELEAARTIERLTAQLRECAETLGADQIDEMRASRAYADAMALLAEMSHISRTDRGDASLKEQ